MVVVLPMLLLVASDDQKNHGGVLTHVSFGVVKPQLHTDHLGVTVPGDGLQILRPDSLPADGSRQLNLVLFTAVTHVRSSESRKQQASIAYGKGLHCLPSDAIFS